MFDLVEQYRGDSAWRAWLSQYGHHIIEYDVEDEPEDEDKVQIEPPSKLVLNGEDHKNAIVPKPKYQEKEKQVESHRHNWTYFTDYILDQPGDTLHWWHIFSIYIDHQ